METILAEVIAMDFGEIIRVLREANNMSRKELANYQSRSISFVRKIEVERNSAPPKEDVKRISELFQLDFDGLWKIASRERMIKWFIREGVDPYRVVVLKRVLGSQQRRWVKECPNLLKQAPYKRFVIYDGLEEIRKLREDYIYRNGQ